MQPFLAAAVQMRAGTDKEANLARAESLVDRAVARGAALVVLPEVFSWRGAPGDEVSGAEEVPGSTSERCAAWARRHGIHLVAGSVLERIAGSAKTYNTSVLLDPRGEILGRYRKAHLFDVDIPGRVSVRESDSRQAGGEIVVVPTELAIIGLSVCYDLRFPELYRAQALAGATLLAVPSAFTAPTGAAHWETLVRARAIENQAYVVAADQCGETPRGTRDHGHSMIVDPWGVVLAAAGDDEGILLAEIDLTYQARVREQLPCLQHVRFGR